MSDELKHVVGFSGGIDSQACARWALNRYPKDDVILLNSDAGGNEHPITTGFVEWYSRTVHPVICIKAIIADLAGVGQRDERAAARRAEFAETDLLTFDRLAYIKGLFPSRTRQFCTDFLKLRPANRWIKQNLRDKGFRWRRYSGVRRQEGKGNAANKRTNKQPVEWDESLGCELFYPIVDWTKQMCFDYVKYHGEQVNDLYTLGFDRVGCAPCVNSGKDDILAWAQRAPEMIDKVREWERRVGMTFFGPVVPGMKLNFIDDVVEWSKTTRGGKQYALHVLYERPACESDYGLCE